MGTLNARFFRPRAPLRLHAARKCRFAPAFLVFFALSCHALSQQGSPDQREYAVKAAYLFHFTQFIEWPPEATPPPGAPIRIGVVEPNPFGTILDEIVRDETVNGCPVEILPLNNVEDASACQIVFVPGAAGKARKFIENLSGKPILLVGENLAFVEAGGAMALVRQGEQVVIAINREALQEAQLTASSRLLRLAQTPKEAPGT